MSTARDADADRVGSESGAEASDGFVRLSLAPFRRYWWVMIALVIICASGGVLATTNTPTTYTGRASLIVSSNNRAPDQDAVLVSGYVDYFDDLAYQRALLDEAQVTTPVTLDARAAAASPILIIEATASNVDDARAAAADVARAFQSDINRVRDAERSEQIADLEERIDAASAPGGDQASVSSLQDQLTELQDDRVNRLQELQLEGGVSQNTPNLVVNTILGAFGGLVLGMLLSLALYARKPRRV